LPWLAFGAFVAGGPKLTEGGFGADLEEEEEVYSVLLIIESFEPHPTGSCLGFFAAGASLPDKGVERSELGRLLKLLDGPSGFEDELLEPEDTPFKASSMSFSLLAAPVSGGSCCFCVGMLYKLGIS
jgi:hypothetical protein